ncbi:diacylglycerol kinase family protein [Demequina sp. NBRC 110057]|uniref:diacylglycerol/lipid kinase family protein n=1 Tax=Demequina sp. NBRC 110057 TaxID=1570346 RepID=UPI000A032B0A|nr:diacylglycerol kinase family protein [Demequina sp. NBRC 110057]
MSRVGVVTNPAAGSGRGAGPGARTLAGLTAAGHDVTDLTRGSWAEALEAADAAASSLDALVVVGGDGMVHLGAQVCAERDLPLGIVAAGSGNDLAATVGLPVGDVAAGVTAVVDALADQASSLTIDLGKVTSDALSTLSRPRYFAGVLSAGVDAAIAARGMRLRVPRGPAKYKVAIGLELPRFRPYGARLTLDGHSGAADRYTLIAIANGTFIGGGIPISPSSSLTDGMLEVITADALTLPQIAAILPRLQRGEHLSHPAVHVRRAREVTLAPANPGAALPVASADGELVCAAPVTVTCVPGALRLLVPGRD